MVPSATPASPSSIIDRRDECGQLDRLLERARSGGSASVVVRGEAGVGKTARATLGRESDSVVPA